MRWDRMLDGIHDLVNSRGTPDVLVMHCGANDLGELSAYKLRNIICMSFDNLHAQLPNTLLVWSQMLPRLSWREVNNASAMNSARVRVNRAVAAKVLALDGAYIKYPEISVSSHELFEQDGVHLSHYGNAIFLNIKYLLA